MLKDQRRKELSKHFVGFEVPTVAITKSSIFVAYNTAQPAESQPTFQCNMPFPSSVLESKPVKKQS
jgi:hypothetical protein